MQGISLGVLTALATLSGSLTAAAGATVNAAEVVGASALHSEWLDKTADPLTDFFQYANGGFIRNYPIPPAA